MVLSFSQNIIITSLASNIISFITGVLITYLLFYGVKRIQDRKNLKKDTVVYSKDLPIHKLVETIRVYLDKHGTAYRYDSNKYLFEITINGVKGVHDVTVLIISVRPNSSYIKFEILICNMISDSAVSRVTEFVTRLNSTPNLGGNYIFNYEERYCLFTDNLHLMDQPLYDHHFRNFIMNLVGHYSWTAKAFSDIATNNHEPLLTYLSLMRELGDKTES